MTKYKYRYSILVPTHQRAALLRGTLRGLLLQSHDNYEIVVSNNFSRDETRAVLAEFASESRIRILHTDRKMSMPEHWEFAMEFVAGEFVVVLGDDDGIRPDCLRILDRVIGDTQANLLKFKTGLYYHNDWVDEKRNTFEFDTRCSNRYFTVDRQAVLEDFCAFRDYSFFPNLLQACFSLELYRKAKQRCGTVFVGAPDWSCPFLLLMDENAKLVYIDSTLGYGGRSQMSNAAYYENAANEFRNDRLTDFINELSADVRFPYHSPQITTAGNFTPAAFSYAKHFYPDALARFDLDRFELAKVIQQDIAEEAVSGRQAFWTATELASFDQFVGALSPRERRAIAGMPGYSSVRARFLLALKRLKRAVVRRFPGLVTPTGPGLEVSSRYPFNVSVDIGQLGITTGDELMKGFNSLVRESDRSAEVKSDGLLKARQVSPAGQLALPLATN